MQFFRSGSGELPKSPAVVRAEVQIELLQDVIRGFALAIVSQEPKNRDKSGLKDNLPQHGPAGKKLICDITLCLNNAYGMYNSSTFKRGVRFREWPFQSPEAFVAFLSGAARNLVGQANRKFTRQPNTDRGREVALDSPAACGEGLHDPQPGPDDLALAEDAFFSLKKGQTVLQQQILHMLRLGYSHQDIAHVLDVNEKTIRRLLQKLDSAPNRADRYRPGISLLP